MKTEHLIINGDSRNMSDIKDESVHLIITSPPYWQLKDYGSENQIGFNDSYEDYINNLNLVWNESYRVLHKGCRLCVNIGDQFARAVYYGRYKVIPIRTEIIKFCESIGFDYMGAIIWQKVTTTNTTGGAAIMGSYPYPRNGILKLDYEFILIFKKQGEAPKVEKYQKEESIISKEEWNRYFQGHWNFPGERQTSHIAMFPEELPKRLIKMFSFVGETVLDPFLGSGTTSLASLKLNRNSIGYEINPEFLPTIKQKLGADENKLFNDSTFIIKKQILDKFQSQIKIDKLSYIFRDPHLFNKKVDLKKLQFGSKIDSESLLKKEDLFTVKEIINVEKLRLNNDLIVKLIGIKENKGLNGEAISFLMEKIKGKRVFLKFDDVKYDGQNNLLCYLYLENKTFINAHLIKSKLANVDNSIEFKYKDKFNCL